MGKKAIIWFRNDLRIHDNESLLEALQLATDVIPVYIFDERVFYGSTKYGFRKTGLFRAQFIIESVCDLRENLKLLGSDLFVRVGKPENILFQLAKELKSNWVFCNRERTDEEVKVQDALEKNLWSIGQEIRYNRGKMLYHTADLPFPVNRTPDSFSVFRKEVEKLVSIRTPLEGPKTIPPLDKKVEIGEIPDLRHLNYPSGDIVKLKNTSNKGGEKEALKILNDFILRDLNLNNNNKPLSGYQKTAHSSNLGAYLSQGCISPKKIYQIIKIHENKLGPNKISKMIILELMLRDFYRLQGKKHGNNIFKIHGTAKIYRSWKEDFHLFKAWTEGRTGMPFIDAHMRQLNSNGFISGIGRQNVATFLINKLNINWQIGAEYFESLLIDYDPCSNYGNWNTMAGVSTNPRDNLSNNLIFQSRKYDLEGTFIKKWIPELIHVPLAFVHKPDEMDQVLQVKCGCVIGKDYPAPIEIPVKTT